MESTAKNLLKKIQDDMFIKAKKHLEAHINDAKTYDEFKEILEKNPGFIRAMWCGNVECEDKIKEETGATSRCIPFDEENISDKCICCGKEAKHMVFWGKAY